MAALALPGVTATSAQAQEADSVSLQTNHYEESNRTIYGNFEGQPDNIKLPHYYGGISADTLNLRAHVNLRDRWSVDIGYVQDTWSGATPVGTAPAVSSANTIKGIRDANNNFATITGATPLLFAGNFRMFPVDRQGNTYSAPNTVDNQYTDVLTYASPETRRQGSINLNYEWDKAAVSVGAGLSREPDYKSDFVNVGGRFDFNQKQTTFSWGLSYTHDTTNAKLDPDELPFLNPWAYLTGSNHPDYVDGAWKGIPKAPSGHLDRTFQFSDGGGFGVTEETMHGTRQDWGAHLGLTQVLDKNSLLTAELAYTRSTGYLANPYKVVYDFEVINFDSTSNVGTRFLVNRGIFGALIEVRPNERNQFDWHLGYKRYISKPNAALSIDYHFAHDDWGIRAHTLEAAWEQPFGGGWSVTPRVRYYSQTKANFYVTSLFEYYDVNPTDFSFKSLNALPEYYSSDGRLAAYGALSGGLVVDKKLGRGIVLEAGFEYYAHKASLKLGGGSQDGFDDYHAWSANLGVKLDFSALGSDDGTMGGMQGMDDADHHHAEGSSPAGIMFDHTLGAGMWMLGYRFMRSTQGGSLLLGDNPVTIDSVRTEGCGDRICAVTPRDMSMNMHMLEIMYAPSDAVTFMLTPQFVDMGMEMTPNPNFVSSHGTHAGTHSHYTGGIGDTGLYALFPLIEQPIGRLTLALGGTAPTGSVNIKLRKTMLNENYNQRIHYGMQLGSGTWDLNPSLTYAGDADNLFWGLQLTGTKRLGDHNEAGYRLGDVFQSSAWAGYEVNRWLSGTVRGVYTAQGRIHGAFNPVPAIDYDGAPTGEPFVPEHVGPFDQPANYGGKFVDIGVGLNIQLPKQVLGGSSLKFEYLQPVKTTFNGYQLDRENSLTATWSVMF